MFHIYDDQNTGMSVHRERDVVFGEEGLVYPFTTSSAWKLALTSRGIAAAMQKVRAPVNICLNIGYWNRLPGPPQNRLDTVLPQLNRTSERFSIVKLELFHMGLKGTEEPLLQAVAHSTNLTHLDLRLNDLKNEGATNITQSLANCTSLQYLDLTDNHITDHEYTDAGGDFRRDPRGTPLLGVLSGFPLLQTLNLRQNFLGAAVLVGCTALTTLDVRHTRMGRELNEEQENSSLIVALGNCQALKNLRFCNNFMDSVGMLHFAGVLPRCRQLKTLNLGDNPIGDAGVASLAAVLVHLPALEALRLPRCRIRDAGVHSLAVHLEDCRALSTLFLENNLMTNVGAASLAAAIPHCALQELILFDQLDRHNDWPIGNRESFNAAHRAQLRAAWQGPPAGLQLDRRTLLTYG